MEIQASWLGSKVSFGEKRRRKRNEHDNREADPGDALTANALHRFRCRAAPEISRERVWQLKRLKKPDACPERQCPTRRAGH